MLSETSLELHHEIIHRAEQMRALPRAVLELAAIVARPDAGIGEIADAVRLDPVIGAALLREANSAAASTRTPADTVEQSVMRLGAARVLAVAIGTSLHGELSRALPVYGQCEGQLQRHSMIASYAAEVIRLRSRLAIPPAAVTGALLHDIGKLVLCDLLPTPIDPRTGSALAVGVEHEQGLLDVNHGEVGALLARAWSLPETIAVAIEFHHHPEDAPDDSALAVACADVISHLLVAGEAEAVANRAPDSPDEQASTAEIDAWCDELGVEFSAVYEATAIRIDHVDFS